MFLLFFSIECIQLEHLKENKLMAVVFFATPIKSFHQFSSMSHFHSDRLGDGVGQFCKIEVSINVIFRWGIYLTISTRPQALGMSEFKGGWTQEKSGMRINKRSVLILSCGHTIFTKKLHGCLPPPI